MTVTGRISYSEPAIQNLPGSLADKLSKAFETNNYTDVLRELGTSFLSRRAVYSDAGAEPVSKGLEEVFHLSRMPAGGKLYEGFEAAWTAEHERHKALIGTDYAEVVVEHTFDDIERFQDSFLINTRSVTIKVRRL